jgi:hypothetical protein
VKLMIAGIALVALLPAQTGHPVPRTDPNSRLAHEQLLAKARQGHIDIYAGF